MTTYRTENSPITGMSDNDFYGREPAPGVDIDACKRAAVREVRHGLDSIIHGQANMGRLKVRRAALRLAIALGNQSDAESYLGDSPYSVVSHATDAQAAEGADRAELDRAVAGKHRHPALLANLKQIEASIVEAKATRYG